MRSFKRYGAWLLPDKRPMDNMPFAWERPQEDEFALALLGLPSTYTDLAFPNRVQKPGALDLSSLSPAELAKWKRVFMRFLKEVTVRTGKRLVLKSPPHTARVPVLPGDVPGRQVRSHRPRPACRLPFDGQLCGSRWPAVKGCKLQPSLAWKRRCCANSA